MMNFLRMLVTIFAAINLFLALFSGIVFSYSKDNSNWNEAIEMDILRNRNSPIIINEIAYDYRYWPENHTGEWIAGYPGVIWIEIVNIKDYDISLDNISIVAEVGIDKLSGVIHPKEIILLTNNISYLKEYYDVPDSVRIIFVKLSGEIIHIYDRDKHLLSIKKIWHPILLMSFSNLSSNIYQRIPDKGFQAKRFRISEDFGWCAPSLPDGCSWSRFSGFYNTGRFEEDFYIETHPTPGKPNRILKSEDSPMLHIHIPDEYDFNSVYILIASTSITVLFIIFGVIKYGKKRGIKL